MCGIVSFVRVLRFILSDRPDAVYTHPAKEGTTGEVAVIFKKFVLIFYAEKTIMIYTYQGHYFYDYFDPVTTRVFTYIIGLKPMIIKAMP